MLQAFEKKFGASVYEGYGLSEASPIVTAHKKGIPIKPGSVGIPIPGVELKVVDATGQEVPRGVIGEIVLRGEHITPGYFQNERESEKAIVQGWLHTGDIGQMDDEGYLYIVDRKKDLIIKNGFNIYPRDLEEVLSRHKAVIETAVIGVPDQQSGEEVMACVVKKPNEEVTEEELIAYCAEQIAKNKLPKHIVFLSELPRNGVGKVLKASLRKSIAEGKV
ncbi:class I adenylate-forming enzyme family protein [Gracilibacillus sp. Marseille-QA3620]